MQHDAKRPDAQREERRSYLTLNEAARELPGRPHLSTLHRWRLRGVRGVRLQTCLVGGRRFTTQEWLTEFIDHTSAASDHGQTAKVETSRQRESSIDRAERTLERDGI